MCAQVKIKQFKLATLQDSSSKKEGAKRSSLAMLSNTNELLQWSSSVCSKSPGDSSPRLALNTPDLRRSLSANERMTSEDRKSRYVCPICGKQNRDKFDLQRHFKTHTGEKPYHCNLCPYECTQKPSLKMHMIRVHGDMSY